MKWIRHIGTLATMRSSPDNPLGVIHHAAIGIRDDVITWIGPECDVPAMQGDIVDAQGCAVMPGLIDCHTHLVFAGTRIDEFVARSRGASYAEILLAGGGIRNTMRATRAASVSELVELALPRLARMAERGLTTVESKTGYGLNLKDELKMFEVISLLNKQQSIRIYGTFLGAHAVPPEFHDRPDDYVEHVIVDMIPAVAEQGIATACDVFVEKGAFSVPQARRIFEAAMSHGLKCKVHAEQLSHTGAAQLAAEIGALSASHLEYTTQEDWQIMSKFGVVAELLPVAQEYLGMTQLASGRAMTDAGLRVAVATDFNPGSSNCNDLWLAARLAVTRGGLTVDEALLGITRYAAEAMGLKDVGVLDVGMKADVTMLKTDNIYQMLYDWCS